MRTVCLLKHFSSLVYLMRLSTTSGSSVQSNSIAIFHTAMRKRFTFLSYHPLILPASTFTSTTITSDVTRPSLEPLAPWHHVHKLPVVALLLHISYTPLELINSSGLGARSCQETVTAKKVLEIVPDDKSLIFIETSGLLVA
jgi:hypothetical protein